MARRPVWPHVASILVMLLAAFAFALLADWAPSALSQAALAGLSLTLVLAAAVLSLPALVARTGLRRWLHWQTQIRFTAAGLPFLAALVILIIAARNGKPAAVNRICVCQCSQRRRPVRATSAGRLSTAAASTSVSDSPASAACDSAEGAQSASSANANAARSMTRMLA